MKFLTIRDLRNKTATIRKSLPTEHEMIVTANGRPFAIIAHVDEDSFEERLKLLRRARALENLDRAQARSKRLGLDKMTMEEINAEIEKSRQERRAR